MSSYSREKQLAVSPLRYEERHHPRRDVLTVTCGMGSVSAPRVALVKRSARGSVRTCRALVCAAPARQLSAGVSTARAPVPAGGDQLTRLTLFTLEERDESVEQNAALRDRAVRHKDAAIGATEEALAYAERAR